MKDEAGSLLDRPRFRQPCRARANRSRCADDQGPPILARQFLPQEMKRGRLARKAQERGHIH